MKIKVGDNVRILSGNDKGKEGEVLKVIPKESKVVVKGVNIRKKHKKATRQGEQSGIIEYEFPINVSKVGFIDPKTKETSRIGYKIDKNNKKIRISKKSNQEIK